MHKRTRMSSRLQRRKTVEAYLFSAPWIIGFLVFFTYPVVTSFILSFSRITNIQGLKTTFVGLTHYKQAFTFDINFVPMFLRVVRTTLIQTVLILIFSFIIARFVNRKMVLRGFFRQVFFLPVLLGTGFVMQELLGQGVNAEVMEVARGILMPEKLLLYLGPKVSEAVGLFFDNITLALWKSGVQIILFLAGMQGIPASLYEAARVDSATEWDMLWKITLPMMAPVILLNIIYTLVDSFSDSSNEIIRYIRDIGFKGSVQFEYASAIGWIYMAFIIVLVAFIFLIMRPFNRRAAR